MYHHKIDVVFLNDGKWSFISINNITSHLMLIRVFFININGVFEIISNRILIRFISFDIIIKLWT